MDDKETLRDGRYVVLRPLGEGAQGRTFDGVDKREGQPVAIKRFDVRGASSWKDVDLAEREARVLQALSHPKLPRYVDRFEEGGALYLVMEKFDGESLASMRKRGALLDEKAVFRFLADAAEVLDYLHGRSPPVIHRDLKPGNVLRRPDGSFAFVDFGAVRDKLRPDGGSTVVGTFGYMAPEQFQGRALPTTDIYAVGATAVTMLSGRDPEELPHKGLRIDVRTALRGRASGRLIEILERMLDPDPDQRASRIGPLLDRAGARSRQPKQGIHAEHVERFTERRARRQARHAERMARRIARRRHGPPFPISLLLTVMFLVAMLVVTVVTHVVVPIVLTVLSLFFARRALSSATQSVRQAGRRAVEAMEHAREGARAEWDERPDDKRVRLEDEGESPRVRVEDASHAEEDLELDDELDVGSRARR